MSSPRFPVMLEYRLPREGPETRPRSVAWSKVEPLRASCRRLHDQSLETLASRGGLAPAELFFHVHGLARWRDMKDRFPEVDAWFREWAKEE